MLFFQSPWNLTLLNFPRVCLVWVLLLPHLNFIYIISLEFSLANLSLLWVVLFSLGLPKFKFNWRDKVQFHGPTSASFHSCVDMGRKSSKIIHIRWLVNMFVQLQTDFIFHINVYSVWTLLIKVNLQPRKIDLCVKQVQSTTRCIFASFKIIFTNWCLLSFCLEG